MSVVAEGSVTVESRPRRHHYLNVNYGVRSWLFTVDHKRIALLYLVAVTLFFFIGGAAAVLFRMELLTPQGRSAARPRPTTSCSPCMASS